MQDNRLGNHTGLAIRLVIAAGSLLLMGGGSASALVNTRGVNTPAVSEHPQTSVPVIGRPDPEEVDWDDYLQQLLELLCVILQCDDAGQGTASQTDTSEKVAAFIESYETNGLKPYLTGDEIARGLQLSMTTKAHIQWGMGTPGTLTSSEAVRLSNTVADIISDLHALEHSTKTPPAPSATPTSANSPPSAPSH